MNLAARIAQSAQPSQVLVSERLYHELEEQRSLGDRCDQAAGGSDELVVSDAIRFQHWKGIVEKNSLREGLSPDDDRMRMARLVGLDGTRRDEWIRYKWPYQCITLFSGPAETLSVFKHQELRNNIRSWARVRENTEQYIRYAGNKDPVFSPPTRNRWQTLARMCAFSFEEYTDTVRRIVTDRFGASVVPYSHPIHVNWPQDGSCSKVHNESLRSPLGSRSPGANPAVTLADACLCFLSATHFAAAQQLVREFNCRESCVESAPLVGEWDLFALVKGANRVEEIREVVTSLKMGLRPGSGIESGLILDLDGVEGC